MFKISRMLRTGALFYSKFRGCSARERDVVQNFEDALHGSAILFEFSGCSARERNFLQNLDQQDELQPCSSV